jgi:hypothetical protein
MDAAKLPQKSSSWESWLALADSVASDDEEEGDGWEDWEEILKDDEAGDVVTIPDLESDV